MSTLPSLPSHLHIRPYISLRSGLQHFFRFMSKRRCSLPSEFTPIALGTDSIQVREGGKAQAAAFPLRGKSPGGRGRGVRVSRNPNPLKAAIYMHTASMS